MLTDLLVLAGVIAAWLFLSPCSPWTVWRGGSCAWKPGTPPDDPSKP